MSKSTITSKGQTTIPADIRAFLGVGPGDELQYARTKSGTVEIAPRKKYTWRDLSGILPKPRKALTIEEMDQAIADAIVAKYERSLPKPRKTSKK